MVSLKFHEAEGYKTLEVEAIPFVSSVNYGEIVISINEGENTTSINLNRDTAVKLSKELRKQIAFLF